MRKLQKIQSLDEEIQRIDDEIERLKIPPDPLCQNLPERKDTAMSVIFFLKMPLHFRVLLRMSFMAQQMLLPPQSTMTIKRFENQPDELDVDKLIQKRPSKLDSPLDWSEYWDEGKGWKISTQAILASSDEYGFCKPYRSGGGWKIRTDEWKIKTNTEEQPHMDNVEDYARQRRRDFLGGLVSSGSMAE